MSLITTYIKPYKLQTLLCFLCVAASSVCELLLPMYMSVIVNDGVGKLDMNVVINNGILMMIWALASMALTIGSQYFSAYISMAVGRDIRSALYKHAMELSSYEINGFGVSTLITRTTNDVQQLERFIQMALSIAIKAPIMLVGSVVLSVITSPSLSLVAFCSVPIVLFIAIIIMRWAMPLMRIMQKKIDALNLVTREGLTGLRVIRAYCQEDYEQQRFERANKDLSETNVTVSRRISLLIPAFSFVMNLAIVVLLWIGGVMINAGSIDVGSIMAALEYQAHVLISVAFVSGIIMLMPRAFAAAERIDEVLKTPASILDCPQNKQRTLHNSKAHEVRFEHVSFAFPGAKKDVLSDINLTFEAGKTYVIIGTTGSGRSTIANLIERFLDPTSGRVLIDGIDIAILPQQRLRSLISYAPQKTVLFSGTIADNIRYGYEDASDEEVQQAAIDAQAYDFIMRKKDGFKTKLTQAGGGLSGGQKQRIAIARAIIKRTGLFIFDDSFCALDFKTESLVRRALKKRCGTATTIMIAQRVNTALTADCVMVLDAGRVVGWGTHEQLMKECVHYQNIVASQLKDQEVAYSASKYSGKGSAS